MGCWHRHQNLLVASAPERLFSPIAIASNSASLQVPNYISKFQHLFDLDLRLQCKLYKSPTSIVSANLCVSPCIRDQFRTDMPLEWDIPTDVENLIFEAIGITQVYVPESYYDMQPPHTISRAPEVATTLLVCSCVCKVWRKYALERLFRIVKLKQRHLVSALSQFKRSWNIDFQIKTLSIHWQENLTKESFTDIFAELKGLQSLIVGGPFQLSLLHGSVPNLRFLELSIMGGILRQELMPMLVGVPQLKVLHLHIRHRGYVYQEKNDGLQPLSIKLEEFSISQYNSENLDFWLWLLQSSEHSLHTVTINGVGHVAADFNEAFQLESLSGDLPSSAAQHNL